MQDFLFLVGKSYIIESDGMRNSAERMIICFQRCIVHSLFDLVHLVIQLREFARKVQCFEQRYADRQSQAEHKYQISKRRCTVYYHQCSHRQHHKCHTRYECAVKRHPRPTDLVPRKCEIPVAFDVILIALIGFAVPPEYLYDLHAVDILNYRSIHFSGSRVIIIHFRHTRLEHHTHCKQSERQRTKRQQCQSPVGKKHANNGYKCHRQIGDPLRNCVCKQQLYLFDIIGEKLFDLAVAHVMDSTERLSLQLFLQGYTEIFQRVVC